MAFTRADITRFIQREDDELLGYHPWDEGTGLEDNAPVSETVADPAPDPWPYDEGTP